MNTSDRQPGRTSQTIQVWTWEQTRAALPYLGSVMRSLREHYLEQTRQRLAARRLADRPGRPDRASIIALQDALAAARHAEERFREAEAELHALDVYCIDPVGGLALVPFAREDRLAWFIYELFEDEPVRFWRYHNDKPEARRPVGEILGDEASRPDVVV